MNFGALRDVCERVDYGVTTSATDSGGPKFLRITDIDQSHVDWSAVPYCKVSDGDAEKYSLATGDVVVARTGASTGRSQWVEVTQQAVFASYLVRFRAGNQIDSRYLSYVLASRRWHEFVSSVAYGKSAQPNMSAAAMAEFQFELPDLSQQRAIAEVLGALDDKIAANARALRLLDELVRTKFSGLSGEMIPLNEVATNVRSQVEPNSAGTHTTYVGLEHIPRRRMWLTESGLASEVGSAKLSFEINDVLFGKLRPYFHKVVVASIAGIASTDILVVRAKRKELSGLVLAVASADATVRATTAASGGTRMPRTSWSDLGDVRFPWPGEKSAHRLSAEIIDIAKLAGRLARESKAIAHTRDELLPLLMSGKVRVRDAEKTVEGVL
ncbi:MAG: restriction endonuclease subunit S [Rhodoglobus sp.]